MQIDIDRQKVSRHFNLTCFTISADRHGLLAPEKKLENQFPCSQKHSF